MTEFWLALMFIGIVMTMTGWFMIRSDDQRRPADD
jgi:hypothetical protein